MKELSEDQKKNQEIYRQVKELLSQTVQTQEEHSGDAHIFISVTQLDNKDGLLTCVLGGGIPGFTQALMQVCSASGPDHFKRAVIIALANLMVLNKETDSKMLGAIVGEWYEREYGSIECPCDKCEASRKAKIKNNINLN